jgi:hypothetical protein
VVINTTTTSYGNYLELDNLTIIHHAKWFNSALNKTNRFEVEFTATDGTLREFCHCQILSDYEGKVEVINYVKSF